MLLDTMREVLWFVLTFFSLQRHRHAHTHRLPWTPLKWPEAPRDDDIIGFDGRRALEGAPQTNVCAVDRLNLLRCVYTHPADLQHACNMRAKIAAAELTQ